MDYKVAKRRAEEEMCARIRYVMKRREAIANRIHEDTPHDIASAYAHLHEGNQILSRNLAYMTTHLGRNAYGTTRYKTCKVSDYKHRKGVRRDATQNTFAHNVDLHRAWTHFRSHFVKGGRVWARMSRSEKKDYRSAIHHADLHVRKYGDYVGAFEMIRGK